MKSQFRRSIVAKTSLSTLNLVSESPISVKGNCKSESILRKLSWLACRLLILQCNAEKVSGLMNIH